MTKLNTSTKLGKHIADFIARQDQSPPKGEGPHRRIYITTYKALPGQVMEIRTVWTGDAWEIESVTAKAGDQ